MQLLGPRRLLLLLLPVLALAWLLLPLVTPHAPTLIVLRALQVGVAGCVITSVIRRGEGVGAALCRMWV